jgi:radical SAM superfamily enzyme YgiQ (UPF0313 family)
MGLLSLAGQIETVATPVIVDVNKGINTGRIPLSGSFYDAAAGWLLETRPDLVGIMTDADSYHHVVRMTQALKAQAPDVITVLGGPYASAVHSETISAFPSIDYIIRGEGEIAFEQLVRGLQDSTDLAKVGNLTRRTADGVVASAELPLIADLDTLPWPDLTRVELIPDDVIYVEIGRGCPFRCNFCFTAPYWKRKHRIKSAERVIAELIYFRDRFGRVDFNFTHDLLTTDRRWVLDFCQKAAAQELGVTWTCSSRTDTIDPEQIEWMRKAGCRDIYFGMETGTPEMQISIDKHLDLGQSRAIIRTAADEGIGATVGFIAGLPGETASSLRGTLAEAFHYLSLDGTTIHLFGFQPYKGSSKFDEISSQLILDDRFLDFPLPAALHAENCAMLRQHFEVFTRFGRLRHFEDLPEAIVRTAEEFFPIINALRPFMLYLADRGLDPFGMLLGWSSWIGEENARSGDSGAGMYAGTIDQFTDFLERFLPSAVDWDDLSAEMLRWEKAKNKLRMLGARPSVRPAEADSGAKLMRNPSLLIEHFERTPSFVPGVEHNASGIFAFYRRVDGEAAIVAVGELAALVLEIARQPMSEGELAFAIAGAGPASARYDVAPLVQRLRELELLVAPIGGGTDSVALDKTSDAGRIGSEPAAP